MVNNKNICEKCGRVDTYAKGLCQRCYKAQNYIDNKDKIDARNALYRHTHEDEIIVKRAQYYIDHKDDINVRTTQYYIDHKDEISIQRKQYRDDHKDENAQYRIDHKDEISIQRAQYRIDHGILPMSENKECTQYLGVYIAERLLANVFTNIVVMPYGNPGFDFICGKGYKVDAKSATLRKDGIWLFNIKKNVVPDYFACLAFDNRDDLNLQHFHLIPGNVINHRLSISFQPSTVHKWSQYEKSTDELLTCCDNMRSL